MASEERNTDRLPDNKSLTVNNSRTSRIVDENDFRDVHRVVVLIVGGLPGSGKSTLASGLVERIQSNNVENSSLDNPELETNDVNCFHIEYDHLQETILNEQEKPQTTSRRDQVSLDAWKKSRLEALEQLKLFLQNQTTITPRKHTLVIMDDNFHLRSMRKQVFQICQEQKQADTINIGGACDARTRMSSEIYFATIWMDIPVEICSTRNLSRPEHRRVDNATIDRIRETCEPPNVSPTAWEMNALTVSHHALGDKNETLISDQAFGFVRSLFFGTAQPVHVPISLEEENARKEKERSITNASKGHQLDQLSRRWVKTVADIRPSDAKVANQIRKNMLHESKQLVRTEEEKTLENPASLQKMFAERVFQASSVHWTEAEKEHLIQALSKQTTTDLE